MLVKSRAAFPCSATNVIVLPVVLLEHPATSRLLPVAPVLVVVAGIWLARQPGRWQAPMILMVSIWH